MKLFTFLISLFFISISDAQPCIYSGLPGGNCFQNGAGSEYIMTTPGNIDFTFDEMRDYIAGVTISGQTVLRLNIDEKNPGQCQWRLIMYIDNTPNVALNEWYPLATYTTNGNIPELDLIQVNVYNGCGTPIYNGQFKNFIGNTKYDVIPIIDGAARNMPGDCDGDQVNGPGNYLLNYGEYSFIVDYYIKPGYQYRAGAYRISIHFCLVEI
jgi:hypothetical protein